MSKIEKILAVAALLACSVPTDSAQRRAPVEADFSFSTDLSGLVVVLQPATLFVGQTGIACAYFKFRNGTYAMRNSDAVDCGVDFTSRYSRRQRSISFSRQQRVDRSCIEWRSSDISVATIASVRCYNA